MLRRMPAALVASGIWSETVGLVFTFVIAMPALFVGLIIVARIAARGEKSVDDELRGRWARKRSDPIS